MRWDSNLYRLCLVLPVFTMLIAGCVMVGPDYRQPPVTVSPNWLEVDDQRVKTGAADHRDWWKVFNDPILDRLIDTAYRENLSLQVAGVRVLEARAQLDIVIGELYPQTQRAFGSVQKIRLSETTSQATFSRILAYSESQIGLSASWELDFWGRFRRAIESADASLLSAVADYDNT